MTNNEYVQKVRDEIEAFMTSSGAQLAVAMTKVLASHTEFKIYDECEHEHKPIGKTDDEEYLFEPGVVEVEDIGMTCNHAYSVCRQCCTDQQHGGDWYQREDCANAHNAIGTAPCWPCQPWLAAGDALSIPRPETQNRRR